MPIDVRELGRHASRYVALVSRGETVEITDGGRVVARLVPAAEDAWTRLVAAGDVRPATTDLLAQPPGDYGFEGSASLAAAREHER